MAELPAPVHHAAEGVHDAAEHVGEDAKGAVGGVGNFVGTHKKAVLIVGGTAVALVAAYIIYQRYLASQAAAGTTTTTTAPPVAPPASTGGGGGGGGSGTPPGGGGGGGYSSGGGFTAATGGPAVSLTPAVPVGNFAPNPGKSNPGLPHQSFAVNYVGTAIENAANVGPPAPTGHPGLAPQIRTINPQVSAHYTVSAKPRAKTVARKSTAASVRTATLTHGLPGGAGIR